MKYIIHRYKDYIATLLFCLSLFTLRGEDGLPKKEAVRVDAAWYSDPFIWIVGSVLFVILIPIILKMKRSQKIN